ncbi:hypothetical protein C0991_009216 [Blastosporella zonata]|nr:hypothetical protein C0991_009216 [Blastosporella zonata]
MPKDYKLGELELVIQDANIVDYPDELIVFTTIPPQRMDETSADNPDLWSECLLYGKAKRAILATPGFPAPILRPPQVRHCIAPSAYGMGLFSTQDLGIGDLILAERPLLVYPTMMRIHAPMYHRGLQLDSAQQGCAHLDEGERNLKIAVDRMMPEARSAYFELHDSHTEDGSGPIMGRARTNSIALKFSNNSTKDERDSLRLSGLHPNATFRFHAASFSCRLYATRPIKAGEEIFIS